MELPTSQSLPEIPEDLCRLIFEIATEDDNRRPTYAFISKSVQGWVEPIIYREVVASTAFHRTVVAPVSSKPLNFFALRVKSLMFEAVRDDGFVADILGRCTSVESLALWYNFNPGVSTDIVREVLRLPPLSPTHLSLSQILLDGQDAFSYHVFSRVTHLDISCPNDDNDWPWSSLGTLKHLTHLSVDVYTEPDDPIGLVKAILQDPPPTLRVLIICICFSPAVSPPPTTVALKALAGGEVDPRVVVAPYNSDWLSVDQRFSPNLVYEELFRSWSTPSEGNALWDRADQVVRGRRAQGAGASLKQSQQSTNDSVQVNVRRLGASSPASCG